MQILRHYFRSHNQMRAFIRKYQDCQLFLLTQFTILLPCIALTFAYYDSSLSLVGCSVYRYFPDISRQSCAITIPTESERCCNTRSPCLYHTMKIEPDGLRTQAVPLFRGLDLSPNAESRPQMGSAEGLRQFSSAFLLSPL